MRELARIITLIFLAAILYSCKSIQYVPVETTKRDTTYLSQTKIDSIYHRDSIYVERKGDTVYLSKYKYLYKYIEKHDTLCARCHPGLAVPHRGQYGHGRAPRPVPSG